MAGLAKRYYWMGSRGQWARAPRERRRTGEFGDGLGVAGFEGVGNAEEHDAGKFFLSWGWTLSQRASPVTKMSEGSPVLWVEPSMTL